jgi:hypothetical protein
MARYAPISKNILAATQVHTKAKMRSVFNSGLRIKITICSKATARYMPATTPIAIINGPMD